MLPPLSPVQRKLADGIILHICRGQYAAALQKLKQSDKKPQGLPALQHSILRQIVLRLQQPNELNPRLGPINEAVIKQLKMQMGQTANIDIDIPNSVLEKIYALAVSQSYEHFRCQLEYIQYMEHTIIQHILILYIHCIKMKMAQQALTKLDLVTNVSMELAFLYCLIFGCGIYMLSFFIF